MVEHGEERCVTTLIMAAKETKLVYASCMLTVPEPVVKTVQDKIFVFLWKNRQNKKSSYYQTVKKG